MAININIVRPSLNYVHLNVDSGEMSVLVLLDLNVDHNKLIN